MNSTIKKGDYINFYISCNSDRKQYSGFVSQHPSLGLVCEIDNTTYELRKLIDINKMSIIGFAKNEKIADSRIQKEIESTNPNFVKSINLKKHKMKDNGYAIFCKIEYTKKSELNKST